MLQNKLFWVSLVQGQSRVGFVKFLFFNLSYFSLVWLHIGFIALSSYPLLLLIA